MNIIAPSSLRSPAKVRWWQSSTTTRNGSSSCLKNSSKFRSILIFIGFVGLLFINNYNTQQQSVENGLLRKTNHHHHQTDSSSSSNGEEVQLDFAVVGFEKTGTTFLLEVLGNHPEIIMPVKHSEESTNICFKTQGGKESLKRWIQQQQQQMQQQQHQQKQSEMSVTTKYGVKCSGMIRKPLGIENFANLATTKIIVGVRHPVDWFQSNYNYRVMLHHKDNSSSTSTSTSTIPSPIKLINLDANWRGVSTTAAQFDKYLKQLGKTSLDHDELSDMLQSLSKSNIRINHNPNVKVFLYTIEQLEDKDSIRRTKFENELQNFLGLQYPFTDFSTQAKSNVNKVSYPEYIDICQPQYDRLRNLLVMEGKKSSEWIINSFLLSEDVVVSNSEYFIERLRTWGVDPCGDNSGVEEE